MILADSSVWIQLLSEPQAAAMASQLDRLATCGPVLQEVLQGLRDQPSARRVRRDFLALPRLSDPTPAALFVAAAEIYRQGRAQGFTLRSSTDCLIAAIAIENLVPVWHRDRDFDTIARFTSLRVLHVD